MGPDDLVIVLAEPLEWGVGCIRHFTRQGLACVEFDSETEPRAIEFFHPQELELAEIWESCTCAPTLTDEDYQALLAPTGEAA